MLLIAISCAWIAGTILGPFWGKPGGLVCAALALAPLIVLPKWKKPALLTMICLLTLCAATFFQLLRPQADSSLQSLNGQGPVEIKGTVSTAPETSKLTVALEIAVSDVKSGTDWQPTRGKVLVFLAQRPNYGYGDHLWLKGQLETPPRFDDFDYQAYLAQRGIFSTMTYPQARLTNRAAGFSPAHWIYSVRMRLSESLLRSLPEPQAALAEGILLGIKSTIPASLKENLSVTGTAHLLAISGMNLTIVAGILVAIGTALFGRRHYIYVWLSLSIIWLYALLTGMQAPVIRSAIMASLFLIAELTGRQKSALVALAFSAAIMVGLDPQILVTASFQLSFLSMAGLILIAPGIVTLAGWIIGRTAADDGTIARLGHAAAASLAVTLGATIAVWPLIAYYFSIVSFIGPLATLVIAPALPLIIVGTMITAFAGLVSAPLGILCGWISWLPLTYMLWMVNLAAAIPGIAVHTGTVPAGLVWSYYVVLAAIRACLSNQKKVLPILQNVLARAKSVSLGASRRLATRPGIFIFLPLGIAAALTALAAASLPDDQLHVSFLSVDGSAILIQTGQQTVVIDSGRDPQALCLELGQRLPFWQRDIDLVILTDPHLEHINGQVEVLKRYRVKQAIAPSTTYTSAALSEWRRLVASKEVDLTVAQTGQSIKLSGGAVLDVLFAPAIPAQANAEDSMLLKLTRGQVSFLLTGDVAPETQKRLAIKDAELACTVLAVPHQGAEGFATPEWLASAQPQIAVISGSSGNLEGEALQKLNSVVGSERVYRTDGSGAIEFITDGRTLRVKVDR